MTMEAVLGADRLAPPVGLSTVKLKISLPSAKSSSSIGILTTCLVSPSSKVAVPVTGVKSKPACAELSTV